MEISRFDEDDTSDRDDIDRGLGAMETERGNLPLASIDVEATIVDLVAETTVRQTFQNPFDAPLEATYTFPLPPRAGVTSFRATFGDRRLEGVLKEREEAREAYREAVESGQRASIVEQERSDVFTMRVGNIASGEHATVAMTMSAPLEVADGEATFRVPLVVAPRYTPGMPLERSDSGTGRASDTNVVPDASRVTPPVMLPEMPNPVELSIEVHVEPTSLEIGELRSTLHATVEEERAGGRHLTVVPGDHDDEAVQLDRDFVLRFDVADDTIGSSARWTPDDEGDTGTFALTLVPPEPDAERRPRDVVFVLDRSGSMSGWKIVAARRAIGRMIESLNPRDRFHPLLFNNVCESSSEVDEGEWIEATDARRHRIVEQLDDVGASGGTELITPLIEALECFESDGYRERRRSIVLVTDGQVTNEDEIVGEVRSRAEDVTIRAVGIDRAVHSGFLERLADATGGRCELVESESRLDEAMERIHRTIASPVVTELDVASTGGGEGLSKTTPEPLPDLFEGVPVRILGRMPDGDDRELTVSGATSDGTTWRETIPIQSSGSDALETIWARRHVRDLEDRRRASRQDHRDPGDLEHTIVETSLRHGVLSRFTAFVAVDDSDETVEGERREVTQPVEFPSGWETDSASVTSSPPAGAHRRVASAKMYRSSSSDESSPTSDSSSEEASGAERPDSYVPPEQSLGGGASVDADVYTLAALSFELLSGEPLVPEHETVETCTISERLRSCEHRLAPWHDVLERALAETPATRFDGARAFLEAFVEAHPRNDAAATPDEDMLAWWVDEVGTPPLSLERLLDSSIEPPRGAALSVIVQLGMRLDGWHRKNEALGNLEPSRVIVDATGFVTLSSDAPDTA